MVIDSAAQYGVRLIVTLADSWNLVDSIHSVSRLRLQELCESIAGWLAACCQSSAAQKCRMATLCSTTHISMTLCPWRT